jgi:hypothetical protein
VVPQGRDGGLELLEVGVVVIVPGPLPVPCHSPISPLGSKSRSGSRSRSDSRACSCSRSWAASLPAGATGRGLDAARAELVLGLVALDHGVLEKDLLDFLVELDGGQLEQLDGLLQLRREREVLGEFELEAGLHDAMMPQSRKCSPR